MDADIKAAVLSVCSVETVDAVAELERRGFQFFSHFGTQNAVRTLREMNQAADDGRLYEYLHAAFGMCQC